MICVLCSKEFDQYEKINIGDQQYVNIGGHNPAPLSKEGRCCSKCNYGKVLPARLQQLYKETPNGHTKN